MPKIDGVESQFEAGKRSLISLIEVFMQKALEYRQRKERRQAAEAARIPLTGAMQDPQGKLLSKGLRALDVPRALDQRIGEGMKQNRALQPKPPRPSSEQTPPSPPSGLPTPRP